ncbi:MAG: copper resistance protein B, partial [Haliea sp.]
MKNSNNFRLLNKIAVGFLFSFAAIVTAFAASVNAATLDKQIVTFLEVERLEHRANEGRNSVHWEAQGWAGTDKHKLWMKTEGERLSDGKYEGAEVQFLYSRMISAFFDAQAGIRYDIEPQPRRGFFVLGLQGLSKQFFEVDTALFVSDDGDVSARLEAEYEVLLTQKLIAQASVETNIAAQSARRFEVGPGFNDIEVGFRLRYEIRREFAPYIGMQWGRKLGRTAS